MSTRTGHKRKAASEAARRRQERRAEPRVPIDLEVDYGCDDTFLFAYIADISILGIFVRTNQPAPPGTRLTLRFTPPGASPLLVKGEVIWINPYRPGEENPNPGMGVRFLSLSPRERDAIGHLVRTFAYLDDDQPPHGQA